jgi:BirA family transcriptional regulator, biotin operon repressor / biotin---[acetyl-CoA-carboxylase] ligase
MGVVESFAGSAETIWQAVMALQQPALAGFSVEVLPEIDSTNTELMRRARAGRTEPTLLVAEQQTAGRGRLGRAWLSDAPPSSAGPQYPSLTFSLGVLLQPQAWDGLSLAVGTSVAGSLHPSIQLKWPNDLWVDGRKLAGILIETAQAAGHEGRYAVIGIGINIAPRPSEGLSTAPAALLELLPSASAAQALESLVAPLLRDVLLFEREGFAAFASRFAARDALHGRSVALLDNAGTAVGGGVAQGVDGSGALLVHTAAGVQAVSSAEVSVRPAV